MEQYKEDVHIWRESLDFDKKELYDKNEMRPAKKGDSHSQTQILEETNNQNLDYLDLQPKTPAPSHQIEDMNDSEED